MSISLSEWLTCLSDEYLTDYIPEGGAAVKVAVVSLDENEAIKTAILNTAENHEYFVADVNAAATKVHMIQDVFFAVSRQVDWRGDIDRYLRRLLNDHGISIDDVQELDDIKGIAESNGRTLPDVLSEIKRLITKSVLRNYRLCREFRTAMCLLCYSAVDTQSVAATDAEVVLQWLQGERASLLALKRMQIFQQIGRHNARPMLRSLSAWQYFIGYRGTMLLLDLQAILEQSATDRYTNVFFAVSRQIDWTKDIDHYLRKLLNKHGILVEDGLAIDNIGSIAELNNRDRVEQMAQIHRIITKEVQHNYRFCREFRTAIGLLCIAAVDVESVAASDVEVVKQWLQGEQADLVVLRRLELFHPIGRQNARLLIHSLSAWQDLVGNIGISLILNQHAIYAERNVSTVGFSYSRSSVIDSYELIRAFIDDTDEMSHLLLVALIGPKFIPTDQSLGLSMGLYPALTTRLVNEVHDQSRDNPLNAMVSLVLCDGNGVVDVKHSS